MTTYREMSEMFGVSKPTVINMAKEIDPEGAHITKRGNRVILDDYLTQALASKLGEAFGVPEKPASKEREASRKVYRSSARTKAKEQEQIEDIYERLLDSEAAQHKTQLEAKEQENEHLRGEIARLQNEVIDLKAKVASLEDKVEAERSRYDALQSETMKSLMAPKPGFWRRLLGMGKQKD